MQLIAFGWQSRNLFLYILGGIGSITFAYHGTELSFCPTVLVLVSDDR